MVALNYQTPDKPMQINESKFRENGNCGYLLRPDFMFQDDFDPHDRKSLNSKDAMTVSLRVSYLLLYNFAQFCSNTYNIF